MGKRNPGWYWVKTGKEWECAKSLLGCWRITESSCLYSDSDFEEIGSRIPDPEELMMVAERRAPPVQPGSRLDRVIQERNMLREALDNLVRVAEGEGGTRPNAMGIARAALKETQ